MSGGGLPSVSVVIPTRNRPQKLRRCLEALADARAVTPFELVVCDSSSEGLRRDVEVVCQSVRDVKLYHHGGRDAGAARNACARAAGGDLLVSVDDDVYVEPDAVAALVEEYLRGRGWRVVAGTVRWNEWSRLGVMRPIGYGRPQEPGEKPQFIVSAFFLYPRSLARALPWTERPWRSYDDLFQSSVWRCHTVHLQFAAQARAYHDGEHNSYGVDAEEHRIYALLADSLVLNRNIGRALGYELLGFMAGARLHAVQRHEANRYVRAWVRGHRALLRDWTYLKALADIALPAGP